MRVGGFTAMELLMALSISAIVMLALSAIMTSVAQGWSYTANAQGYVMAETAGMLRIERLLREVPEPEVPKFAGAAAAAPTPPRPASAKN